MTDKDKATLTAERAVVPENVSKHPLRERVVINGLSSERTLGNSVTELKSDRSPFDIAADKLDNHPGWEDFLEAYEEMKRSREMEDQESE